MHNTINNAQSSDRKFLFPLFYFLALMQVACKFSSASFETTSNSCESIAGTTKSLNSSTWAWDLDDVHECNIERIPLSQLQNRFPPRGLIPPLYFEPIIIVDDHHQHASGRNSIFQSKSSIEGILKSFYPSFPITLSSSNSFSDHRRETTLENYINETINSETLPQHLSNESWYLFGETYSNEWKAFLMDYELPPCVTCERSLSALSFGIGNRGSGVQWHLHGPGFSESLHGRKHWVLYPPSHRPTFDSNYTSRHWMEHIYTSMLQNRRNDGKYKEKHFGLNSYHYNDKDDVLPWECTLQPGEMIYFPDKWYHATLNLDTYTAFVSTFTTEHDIL